MTFWKVVVSLSFVDVDARPPGSEGAREALESIEVARRRRLAVIEPPQWVHWSSAICMVVAGLAYLLVGWERIVVQMLVLVAIFALSFAAQRTSGVVTRLVRPPSRPLAVWIGFIVLVVAAVRLTGTASHAGHGSLGFFALAAFIVTFGPRLQAFWRGVP